MLHCTGNLNRLMRFQQLFDLVGENFADHSVLFGEDNALDTPGYVDRALLCDVAEVAGMEPFFAVLMRLYNLIGSLVVVEIAKHKIWRIYADFSRLVVR